MYIHGTFCTGLCTTLVASEKRHSFTIQTRAGGSEEKMKCLQRADLIMPYIKDVPERFKPIVLFGRHKWYFTRKFFGQDRERVVGRKRPDICKR